MNKLAVAVGVLLLLLGGAVQAQDTLRLSWDYDVVESERIESWKLYQSNTTGGPYVLLLTLPKTANQETYQEVIPTTEMLGGKVYFVLTAYGNNTYEPEERESLYSEEVSYTFPINAPFNLILTILPQ